MSRMGRPPLEFVSRKEKKKRPSIELDRIVPLFKKNIFKCRVCRELGIDISTMDDYLSKKPGDPNYNEEFIEVVKEGMEAAQSVLESKCLESAFDKNVNVNSTMLIWTCKIAGMNPVQKHEHDAARNLSGLISEANVPDRDDG